MIRKSLLAALALAPLLTGCISLTIGAQPGTTGLKMNGPATGYADLNGIRPWDHTILRAHLLDDGELVSLGIWPLAEVGIGFVGARAQILPFEAGVGTLLYSPEPNKVSAFAPAEEPKPEREEGDRERGERGERERER
jgi:hypothetical protein